MRRPTRPNHGHFRTAPKRGPRIGPETFHWYWNPNHPAIRFGPDDFRKQIKEIDSAYEITWNPIKERWLVFARAPKINHPICTGWKLVFVVELDGEYVPLDNRTLDKARDRTVRTWGSWGKYFDHIEDNINAETQRFERAHSDEVRYGAGEYFDYTKIKNIGRGSKFAASEKD